MKLTLHIPRPPSVNALYANVPGKGRVKTKRYRDWIMHAGLIANPQLYHVRGRNLIPFTGDVGALITVNKDRCDLPNLEKAPFDFLKTMGVYKDDKQVIKFTMVHDPECGDLMFIEIETIQGK